MLTRDDVESIDTSGLHKDYEEWPTHCEKALNIKVSTPDINNVNEVIYAGMGGSAASGDILKDWLTPLIDVPFTVLKDYHLPKYADKNALVLIASCSGNTEEALNIAEEAIRMRCRLAVVSSGGKLEKLCGENGIPFTKTKSLRAPRSSLPYLFYPSANILNKTINLGSKSKNLTSSISNIKNVNKEIKVDSPFEENVAKKIAAEIFDKVPVIYASASNRGVATRFNASLNENSKMISHTAIMPELCHNEVESWTRNIPTVFKPVFIRHERENPDISYRFEIVKKIINETGFEVYEIWEKDEALPSRAMGSVYLLDFVSIYSAVLRKKDPIKTLNINTMKKMLRR